VSVCAALEAARDDVIEGARARGAGTPRTRPIHEARNALLAARAAKRLVPAELGAAIGAAVDEDRAWRRAAALDSRPFRDPPAWSSVATEEFSSWVDGEAVGALLDAIFEDDPEAPPRVRDLGSIYEALLEVHVRQLDAASVCFRTTRSWCSAHDVLAEAPGDRASFVARTAELSRRDVTRVAAPLAGANTEEAVLDVLRPFALRALAVAGEVVVEPSLARRRSGSHYTPRPLSRLVLERTLAPLFGASANSAAITSLRVCDPAMGSGAFLVEAATLLAERLEAAWNAEGVPAVNGAALREVVERCLYGVDVDPIAVDLARIALARLTTSDGEAPPDLSSHLKCGDALVGAISAVDRFAEWRGPAVPAASRRFDWAVEFADVFGGDRPGFDACVGNPPWVAYVGRAAQPLAPELARYYEHVNPAFHAYRTLHGLFVRRAAELTRAGGRIGLVLPTSVADLDGYAPTRSAHDALADADRALYDFGDGAFRGVFQPSMALTSTRHSDSAPQKNKGVPWALARTDLDDVAASLLARLDAFPKLDESLFGERGFQSTANDASRLCRLEAARAPFVVPIREGVDIAEFRARAPRTFLDPSNLTGKWRADAEWKAVRVLVRQTARYPIAALADGTAFRNSVLAGFSTAKWTPHALVAYLNSSVARWYHYVRHRDARQGMPQLKIGHLRALPDLADESTRSALDALGTRIAVRNTGIVPDERSELDRIVFEGLDFAPGERDLVSRWMKENPPPKPRSREAD
jgi:metal-sulfur cluster biosynthetic enzyme